MNNLEKRISFPHRYDNRENFTIKIFSFNYIPSKLVNIPKDKKTKTNNYKAKIKLIFKGIINSEYIGEILFKNNGRNNFIYDFKFNETEWIKRQPPIALNLNRIEQLKYYGALLKELNVKQGEKLSEDLMLDTQNFIVGPDKKYNMKLYMEVFKMSFKQKIIRPLLTAFKPDKVIFEDNLNKKEYSSILNLIYKNPKRISEIAPKKEKFFYTLLLFYRLHYDKDLIQDILNKEEIWKYLTEILLVYYKCLKELNVPDKLINEILHYNNKMNDIDTIFVSLSYIHSFENILLFLNNNSDFILESYKKKKTKIKISDFVSPKEEDNLVNINIELEKLIQFQKQNSFFVSIDEVLWKNYIQFNHKKSLKNLVLIKKAIEIYKTIDKNLNTKNFNLDWNIHETGIELINNKQLNNNDILEFIENDSIFKDKHLNDKIFRPISILEGIEIENINEEFYKKWKKINILKLFECHKLNFHITIINKVKQMKYFNILYNLFDIYNNCDSCKGPLAKLLFQKFQNLINTYKEEECPDFIQNTSLLIHILDNNRLPILNKFIEQVIEKGSLPMEIIFKIYIYLSSKYKNSNQVTNYIIKYFTKNKNVLRVENLLYLFNKLESEKIITSILDQVEKYIIKEKDIYNQEKESDSLKILKGINQENLYNKLKKYKNTNYFIYINEVKKTISNTLMKGNIEYNKIFPWMNIDKIKILKERINILFFKDENLIPNWDNTISSFFEQMQNLLNTIKSLLIVLNEFYVVSQNENINKLNDLEKEIKNSSLKDIEKIEKNEFIIQMKNKIPDYEIKLKLKNSAFFVKLFHSKQEEKKSSKISEEEIFKETEKDFKQLTLLFQDNWIDKLDEHIINECHNVIKEINEKRLKYELNFIREHFNLNNVDNNLISKLYKDLIIFSKKEEIFSVINSSLNFIKILNAKKTKFSEILENIRNNLKNNISIEKIMDFCQFLETNEIKIIKPEKEDKDFINILNMLYNIPGSLEFLISLTEEDCRNLQEIAFDNDNCFITSAEIQEMSKCSNFIRSINIINKNLSDIEIISKFRKAIFDSKNIAPYFYLYIKNYSQIKDLFLQKLDKTQATRKKIKNISKKSHFRLSIFNDKEEYFEFFGNYLSDEENQQQNNKVEIEKNITFEDLIELRGRAMLAKRLGEEKIKEENQIFELNQKFSERVNEISKINTILQKIAMKGYSEDITIAIDIIDSKPFFSCELKDFNDYNECNQYLNSILEKTIETQINFYKNKDTQYIRYIYGRQFNLLNSYLRHKGQKSLEPFLKYITNDLISSNLNSHFQYIYYNDLDKEDKYACLLKNCNLFISNFLNYNQLSIEIILQQNQIKEKYKNEFIGLYTYLLEDDKSGEVQKGIEEHILNWYHFLTDHAPIAQTILICNKETTSEEIIAFLYRAFLCEYNIVFTMGNIETLSSEKRQTLTNLINSLYIGHEKEMRSCLIFAYKEKDHTIVRYLENLRMHEILQHKDKKMKKFMMMKMLK